MKKTRLALVLFILCLIAVETQLAPSAGASTNSTVVSWWARVISDDNNTVRVTVTVNKCIRPELRVEQAYIDQWSRRQELSGRFVIPVSNEVCYGTYYKDYKVYSPVASLKDGTIYFTVVPHFGHPD